MEAEHKISVVVPAFNVENYILPCLHSIMNQTYKNLEIIVVDDGSTDATGNIIDSISECDSRIVAIHKRNSGVSSARNAGIEIASGQYITFVDSDDTIEADMYECLLGSLIKYSADISHCGYNRIDTQGMVKPVNGTGITLVQSSEEAVRCLLSGRYFAGGMGNKLYRKELFDNTRLDTTIRFNEDVLVNCELFKKARRLVFTDIAKYNYLERSSSACNSTDNITKCIHCIHASERIFELFKESSLKDICLQRLMFSRIELYRACVMSGNAVDAFFSCESIDCIESYLYKIGNKRQIINFGFMVRLPCVYRVLYRVYDTIRKPNWDV